MFWSAIAGLLVEIAEIVSAAAHNPRQAVAIPIHFQLIFIGLTSPWFSELAPGPHLARRPRSAGRGAPHIE